VVVWIPSQDKRHHWEGHEHDDGREPSHSEREPPTLDQRTRNGDQDHPTHRDSGLSEAQGAAAPRNEPPSENRVDGDARAHPEAQRGHHVNDVKVLRRLDSSDRQDARCHQKGSPEDPAAGAMAVNGAADQRSRCSRREEVKGRRPGYGGAGPAPRRAERIQEDHEPVEPDTHDDEQEEEGSGRDDPAVEEVR
jgi:hypothetical protein